MAWLPGHVLQQVHPSNSRYEKTAILPFGPDKA